MHRLPDASANPVRQRRGRLVTSATALTATILVAASATATQGDQPRRGNLNAAVVGTSVGQMHPDFLLPTLDGRWGRLSDYRGKKIILMHFASW